MDVEGAFLAYEAAAADRIRAMIKEVADSGAVPAEVYDSLFRKIFKRSK